MATSTQNLTIPSPASQSSCYDPLDIDNFINYDPAMSASPSLSPELARSTSSATSNSSFANPSSLLLSPPSTQQTFAGPSHQYDHYKQQAGLPVGALANTVAVNQADPLSFGYYGPTANSLFRFNNTDEFFDFGTAPGHTPSFSLPPDIDMDFGSPQDVFVPSMDSSSSTYIDPAALGREQETIPQPAPNGRAWVGMHQQQAKVQAQQQKEQQAIAQQQKQQLASTQQSQKATSQQSRRSNGSSTRPPTDPIVEERISRLLNHMRQSSVQSSNDDDTSTPTAHGSSSQNGRARKDEEDMDEDERLLASEEGKKLSSKERRQLRNKVSARAFRSRRKEYIGQLEGEIAAKSTEADDLKSKNEELMAENTRLTDLTRMLLSSPAFSVFLNDLSGNGVTIPPAPATRTESSNVKSEPIQTLRKDVNPHQAAAQQSASQQTAPQIGMALIPETSMPENFNYAAFNPTNNIYTDDMDLYDTQVFTVTGLPQGPAVDQIDTSILSGKSSDVASLYSTDQDCKDHIPSVERMPASDEAEIAVVPQDSCDDEEWDESDPAFALFLNQPYPVAACPPQPEEQIFGHIELEKAFGRLELVIEGETNDQSIISAATMGKFERLCSSLEAASERISNMVPYSSRL